MKIVGRRIVLEQVTHKIQKLLNTFIEAMARVQRLLELFFALIIIFPYNPRRRVLLQRHSEYYEKLNLKQ